MNTKANHIGFIEQLEKIRYATINTFGLSVFRCVVAFIVIKNAVFFLPSSEAFFGSNGIYPIENYKFHLETYGLSFLEFPFYLEGASKLFLILMLFTGILYFFGVFKWMTGVVLYYFILTVKLRNGFILDGSDDVLHAVLPFLILAPAYDFFTLRWKPASVTLIPANVKAYLSHFSYIPFLGILIQVCFVYFFTGLSKLQGEMWLNGTATYYVMRVDEFRQTSLNIGLTENHYFVVITTYLTVLWELAFIFLIWFRKTKFIMILMGVTFHMGIWIFMRIDNFSAIMIGTYFLFITNEEYSYFFAWIKNRSFIKIPQKMKRIFAFR